LFFDTLQHHLDTRFAQLNTSVELEFWEAVQSIEDVHNLLTMAKKTPRWPKYSSALWQYLLASTWKKLLRRARERMLD
jgi:hypothetical protein